ncbi:hypothetical protein GCM10027445_61600 [Amycolatopsis endophytica]|uniref:Ribosomal protein S18 acetylase RimI-like enzyme n=1 Tax=Amycolatopsis endophytica TaxID=860233 RepID=A0A853B4L5_9PSEU|nr:ribosomal protein S18 acetylase RimI-like enzyme [Amycolatopsis endophytica]
MLAWQSGYRGLLPDELLDGLEPAQRFERWTDIVATNALPDRGTLVAVQEGRVDGFVHLGPNRDEGLPESVGEIWSFYVRPATWRGGVGRKLMAEALRNLSSAGFEAATLWVLDGNDRAMSFYRACGFEPDGAVKADYRGGALRNLRYRRGL